ncbi:DUF2269 domain-containing protein [Catenulispora subtropica]|uniref:Membrane protein n=1 Tax=Catenulispora subtropica TaxID=450798 RepID=A0ABN2SUZ9_9ACTN
MTGSAAQRRPARLSPTIRKTTVMVHIISSVSWLALMLCLLTLGVAALLTNDADTLRAAYRAMGMLGDALVIPLSLLSLLSGITLGLGTTWGLFRYYWVSAKFWLTLAAAGASIFALTARLHDAADIARVHPVGPISQMHIGFIRWNAVIVPAIALLVYLANVLLSVFKPWGRRLPRTRRTRPQSPNPAPGGDS